MTCGSCANTELEMHEKKRLCILCSRASTPSCARCFTLVTGEVAVGWIKLVGPCSSEEARAEEREERGTCVCVCVCKSARNSKKHEIIHRIFRFMDGSVCCKDRPRGEKDHDVTTSL